MDFYQSMTTKQVRDPTLIHFTIDGRHGILGAHHIAEALHVPYEPSHFEDFQLRGTSPYLVILKMAWLVWYMQGLCYMASSQNAMPPINSKMD